VVIEDAPAGVTAGIRAGMTIVGVATTHLASALDTPHVIPDLSAVTVLPGPAAWALRTGGMSHSHQHAGRTDLPLNELERNMLANSDTAGDNV
jgi:hypothetical protein